MWQVVQEVWYLRENAGMALPFGTMMNNAIADIVRRTTANVFAQLWFFAFISMDPNLPLKMTANVIGGANVRSKVESF